MASQNLLGALAIATAAYAAPANAAPENVSRDFADTNKATVIQVLEHQDSSIQLGFGPDGLLQASGIAAVLSNLDGKDGVEVSNRWMFTRILLGGSDQKEVVGEAQLFQLLKGKNVNQLEELYIRITGDNSGLKISKQNIVSRDGSFVLQGTISDFDTETQAKIRNFQTQLLAQADVIGTISSILLDDPDARTGLQAVIEGKTGQLLAMLDNPEKMAEFKKILEKNGTLDRDPTFLEKLGSALFRIGITAGLPIFSSGTMGAFSENARLSIENGGVANDPWNLTARQGFGQNGAQSVDVSLDLAGLRGGLNFYDPQTSMSKSVSDITNASDSMSAAKQLVDRVNFQYGGDSQDETTRAQVIALGNAYIRSQEQLDSLPNSPAKTDAIAKNTLTYLAKVEAMQGIRWMGLFGTVTPTGWFAGPSFSKVNTSASFANLKTGAGSIEAQILDSKALNAEQVAEYLKGLGITQEGNTYMQNGKVILTIPAGKLVQWSIEEVVTDRETLIRAVPIIISATAVPSSQIIRLTGKNSIARNAYIEKNSRDVATLAKNLRAQNSGMTDLEYSIALGNYDIATTQLTSILNGSRDKTARGLLGELNTLNTPESKKAFFDLFLGKTAGSVVSRKLANRLENGGDIKEDLKKYYNRLAAPFAKQYGLQTSQVQGMFDAILPTVYNKHISTLGETFGGGFNGMVAFNQRNTKQDFVVVATTIHWNARIVGTPSVITNESVANQIRQQIKAKITEYEARVFQQNNPALKGADIDTIKSLMVAGPVSAYLSFDKDAGCFNLGYVAVPGGVPVQGTSSIGSTVGAPEAGVTTFGFGLGQPWKKPKKEEPKQEEPKKEEPKPQEEKPAEPAPKPAEPAPKPVEPVKPVEPPKPPVEPPKPPVEPPKPPVEPPCIPTPKPPAPPVNPNPPIKPNPDVCVPKQPHGDIKPPVVPHPVHPPKPPVVPPKVDKCIPEIPKGVDHGKNFVKPGVDHGKNFVKPGVDHGKNFVKPGVDHVKDAVTKKAAEVCTPTEVVKEGVKGAAKEGVKGAWK